MESWYPPGGGMEPQMNTIEHRQLERTESAAPRRGSRGIYLPDTEKSDGNAIPANGQSLDPHDLAQEFEVKTAERGRDVQPHSRGVGRSLGGEVKPVAAEIFHDLY